MTMTQDEYEAAVEGRPGAPPVTYHQANCPSALSLGELPCDTVSCGAWLEHIKKLREWASGGLSK